MRQQTKFDPSQKTFEAFLDYSGGLNTEVSNEKLRENEFPVMLNIDLSGRGSARSRAGRVRVLSQTGTAQGMFPFYRGGQTEPDIVMAISGRLYVKPAGSSTASEIAITSSGSPFTFQTSLTVEAVQYKTNLYVATGTKIVEVAYTGSIYTAQTVVPYTPNIQEAIYIGTNGLADDPSAYVADGTAAALEVVGINPAKRSGTVNTTVNLVAYINKPGGMASVDYKWEYKKHTDTAYTLGRDFTTGTTGKTWGFRPVEAADYDVKVTVRDTAVTTTTANYTMISFMVNTTEDKTNTTLPVSGIQTCRGIMLHWERLLLYKDATNPFQMYVSDLQNPYYFPTTNTLNYDTGKREPITVAVRFQDMIVVFTKSTVQTLTGKSPQDYGRFLIHDGIGCIADWSAKVVGNVILFRSENGIQRLRPNQYRLETMNVDRVDNQIKTEVPFASDACALVYDNQYWLCFPSSSIVYRFYYDTGVWVKDTSTRLNIRQFLQFGENVYNLTTTGLLLKHDRSVYTDDSQVYDVITECKFLDLSASFNYKKLRRLYVLARHFSTHNIDLEVTVQADSALILTPESGHAVIDPATDTVVWETVTTPNIAFYTGTAFGNWIMGTSPFGDVALSVQEASVRGKCRRVRVRIKYSGGDLIEIYGFGLEFKYKKI